MARKPRAATKAKATPKVEVSLAELTVATKTVTNVSLQAWAIPIGGKGTIQLTPGSSIEIPASAIDNILINLHKRRLVNIR